MHLIDSQTPPLPFKMTVNKIILHQSHNLYHNNLIQLETPSTGDTSHPDRNTQFIPITLEELERRRRTPSITQPLQQHNQRSHNERQPLHKNYPPLNMNVRSTSKPNTRQSKPSTLNQIANSSSASSSSSTSKINQPLDSDSYDDDIYEQHTQAKKKTQARRRR